MGRYRLNREDVEAVLRAIEWNPGETTRQLQRATKLSSGKLNVCLQALQGSTSKDAIERRPVRGRVHWIPRQHRGYWYGAWLLRQPGFRQLHDRIAVFPTWPKIRHRRALMEHGWPRHIFDARWTALLEAGLVLDEKISYVALRPDQVPKTRFMPDMRSRNPPRPHSAIHRIK